MFPCSDLYRYPKEKEDYFPSGFTEKKKKGINTADLILQPLYTTVPDKNSLKVSLKIISQPNFVLFYISLKSCLDFIELWFCYWFYILSRLNF